MKRLKRIETLILMLIYLLSFNVLLVVIPDLLNDIPNKVVFIVLCLLYMLIALIVSIISAADEE